MTGQDKHRPLQAAKSPIGSLADSLACESAPNVRFAPSEEPNTLLQSRINESNSSSESSDAALPQCITKANSWLARTDVT
jgi:hypothetical protein